jgi:16S rRNA G527 N7-methylase RsmG
VHSDRHFTLIESRRKRVNFLRHVVLKLGLANVTVAHGRAEDLSSLGPFVTVLARAVAAPAELVRIIRPLTADGSILVLLTSADIARRLAKVADDFSEVPLPARVGKGLRSSIVVLERGGYRRTVAPAVDSDG